MIVIVVGDCVVIRISFGGTPWVVSSRMVISWCEDLLCLPIVMTLRDFFPILFPAGVGCALQICFLGMGLILWTSLPEPLADPRRFLNHLLRI